MLHRISSPTYFVLRLGMRVSSHENFLASSVCSFPVSTRAPHFFSQENFVAVIENKVDFFLVGFATDFYSQARWRERQQSACE
jgi:hypothetical protein